jgi:uncharacterized CHY-type Zn-finger protein
MVNINSNTSAIANSNTSAITNEDNSYNFEYVPVMVIRTRSNSIFSSEDEITTHDLMSITNDNMENYLNNSDAYNDWNRYRILPSPTSLAIFNPSLCHLCGIVDDDVTHHEYYTGCSEDNLGYNYCPNCKDKFELVIKKRAETIWDLLDPIKIHYFWAPRTRRNPITNQRIYSGPYKYDKWKAVSTYVSYITDNTKSYIGIQNTPFIYCIMISQYEDSINKLISLSDILKSNYNACKDGIYDPTYDPNIDDPINSLDISPDAKIVLH